MGGSSGGSGSARGRRVRDVPVFDSYGRLSWNPNTDELEKIEDQHTDNLTVIERLGGALGEQLSDGLSAWRRSVRRPGWERLLSRVESGESDGIVVWHTDRLFRQPRDLERLIDLGEKGFTVASAHGARDLADPDDRFILRVEVAHAARSSDDKSRRIKRRFETYRAKGRSTGRRRAFGFPGYVPLSREERERLEGRGEARPIVSVGQVEAERQALRDASVAAAQGVSDSQIAREWNAAGLRTVWGRTWVQTSVRDVLARPMNAGIIEHDGVEVGRMPGEPIVDPELFARVRARVIGRRRGRAYGERYVGTGILHCGLCYRPLSAHPSTRKRSDGERSRVYYCPKQRRGCGRISADVTGVDTELARFVVERLSDPEHAAAVNATRARTSERLAEVRAEIERCEEIQRALAERLARRQISVEVFDASNVPLAEDLARLIAERDSLPGGDGVAITEIDPSAVRAEWDNADLAGKCGMLRRAIGTGLRLYIDPASRGRAFNPTRIRLDKPRSSSNA